MIFQFGFTANLKKICEIWNYFNWKGISRLIL